MFRIYVDWEMKECLEEVEWTENVLNIINNESFHKTHEEAEAVLREVAEMLADEETDTDWWIEYHAKIEKI